MTTRDSTCRGLIIELHMHGLFSRERAGMRVVLEHA